VIEDLFAYREGLLESSETKAPAAEGCGSGCLALCRCWTNFRSGGGISGTGDRDCPFAGDRSAHFGGGHRYGCGAAVLSGAGGSRARAGAGGRGRDYILIPNIADAEGGEGESCPRTTARGTRRCVGTAVRAGPGAAPAQVPHPDPALPAWPRANKESAGGDHAAHWGYPARQRPRGGGGLRGAARISGESCWRPAAGARNAGIHGEPG